MNAFAKAEQVAGPGVCPTEGDAPVIEGVIDSCVGDVASALSGGTPRRVPAVPGDGTDNCPPHRRGRGHPGGGGAELQGQRRRDDHRQQHGAHVGEEELENDMSTIHDKDTLYTSVTPSRPTFATLNTRQICRLHRLAAAEREGAAEHRGLREPQSGGGPGVQHQLC